MNMTPTDHICDAIHEELAADTSDKTVADYHVAARVAIDALRDEYGVTIIAGRSYIVLPDEQPPHLTAA